MKRFLLLAVLLTLIGVLGTIYFSAPANPDCRGGTNLNLLEGVVSSTPVKTDGLISDTVTFRFYVTDDKTCEIYNKYSNEDVIIVSHQPEFFIIEEGDSLLLDCGQADEITIYGCSIARINE